MFALFCTYNTSPSALHVVVSCWQHPAILRYIAFTPILFRLQAWVGGFSNLMDELRTFMAGRQAPFRLKGLRAIFVTPEDELDEEDKVCVGKRSRVFCFATPQRCHRELCIFCS